MKVQTMKYSATLYKGFSPSESESLGIAPERWHGHESDLAGVVDCLHERLLVGSTARFWEGHLRVEWEESGLVEETRLQA